MLEESAFRAPGITSVQFSPLSVFVVQPGLDQPALTFAIGVDRATTANVVARLEKRGLLRRRPGATDERVKQTELTATGHRLLRQMYRRRCRPRPRLGSYKTGCGEASGARAQST